MFHQPRHRASRARFGTATRRVALALASTAAVVTVQPVLAADVQPDTNSDTLLSNLGIQADPGR